MAKELEIPRERLERLMRLSAIKPWDRVPVLLEEHFPDTFEQVFVQIQRHGRGLWGFIVCSWAEESDEKPVSFWDESERYWRDFRSEVGIGYPRIFLTLKGALAFIKRLRKREGRKRIGLALWKHAEVDYEALQKYEQMTGSFFPNCPRGMSRS